MPPDSNESGWSGIGYWAPADNHTTGLFIKNVGSFNGKLSDLLNDQSSQIQVIVPVKNTLLMGYTISLPLTVGDEL